MNLRFKLFFLAAVAVLLSIATIQALPTVGFGEATRESVTLDLRFAHADALATSTTFLPAIRVVTIPGRAGALSWTKPPTPTSGVPAAIDIHGRILMSFCCGAGDIVATARYDLAHGGYLRGIAWGGPAFLTLPSPQGIVWSIYLHMGQTVVRSRFGARGRVLESKGGGYCCQYNDLIIDRRGNAWFSGWLTPHDVAGDMPGPHHAPGLASVPVGEAALFYGTPRSRNLLPIVAPAPAPLTGVSNSGRNIWLYDPYTVCLADTRSCSTPRLLSYEVTTKTFTSYPVPRNIAAIAAVNPAAPQFGLYYGFTPMGVSPNGSVWIRVSGHRLIRFHDGAWRAYRVPASSLCRAAPQFTRDGGVLLSCRRLYMLNPSDGRVTTLPDVHGTLLTAPNGRLWYVKPTKGVGRWLTHERPRTVRRTIIRHLRPFTSTGAVAPGFRVIGHDRGSCGIDRTYDRAYQFRCFGTKILRSGGTALYDFCFMGPRPTRMACLWGLRLHHIVIVHPLKPLPIRIKAPAEPILYVLGNGKRCWAAAGTKAGLFDCRGNSWLYGHADKQTEP